MDVGVEVSGLKELRKALRDADPALAKELSRRLKTAADMVATDAKGRVPVQSGRARGSIRPSVSGNKAYVVGGKAKVPYYGWLDFGSRRPTTGNLRSRGPWAGSGRGPKEGRFIYPAIRANSRKLRDLVADAVDDMKRKVDL